MDKKWLKTEKEIADQQAKLACIFGVPTLALFGLALIVPEPFVYGLMPLMAVGLITTGFFSFMFLLQALFIATTKWE